MKIYADNAATTKMSRTAIDAMLPYMDTIYGNPSSLYSLGQEAAKALLEARETVAKCPRLRSERSNLHLRRQRGRQSGNHFRRNAW